MLTPRGCAATILFLSLAACAGGDGESARDAPEEGSPARPGRPASLAAELGCGGCHRGMPSAELVRERAPRLGEAGRRPPASSLYRYLRDPTARRSDIGRSRMPDFHLDTVEAAALTLFLLARQGTPLPEDGGPGPLRRARTRDGVDAARGERIFRALNCAGCHRGAGVEPWANAPPLDGAGRTTRPGWLRRWLLRPRAVRPFGHRPGTGGRMPDFRLTDAEADSLVAVLTGTADAAGPADGPGAGPTDPAGGPALRPEPPSPYRAAKAEALLRRRLPCLGCHQLGGEGGRIGPALDDVASRRPGDHVLGIIREPGEHAPGTVMPPVPMPSGRAELLAGHLLSLADRDGRTGRERGEAAEPPRRRYLSLVDHPLRAPEPHELDHGDGSAATAEGPGGGSLYRGTCAACHGIAGNGNGYNARYLPVRPTPLASADLMAERPDATLFDGIHAGGRILGRSHFMPPFGTHLERGEVWSLVRHVRELCDCEGPAWARDDRDAPGAP